MVSAAAFAGCATLRSEAASVLLQAMPSEGSMAGDGSPPRVSATLSELLATGGGGHSSAAWTCAEPTPEAWEWRGSSLEFGLLEALGLPVRISPYLPRPTNPNPNP
jgi:hypothetical protein